MGLHCRRQRGVQRVLLRTVYIVRSPREAKDNIVIEVKVPHHPNLWRQCWVRRRQTRGCNIILISQEDGMLTHARPRQMQYPGRGEHTRHETASRGGTVRHATMST